MVREAVRLVNGNGVDGAKESADLITVNLDENEEKRRETAPPEASVLDNAIEETASLKEKAPEPTVETKPQEAEK
jgi:hypothetical protein